MIIKKSLAAAAAILLIGWQGIPIANHFIGDIRYRDLATAELQREALRELQSTFLVSVTGNPSNAFEYELRRTEWIEQSKALAKLASRVDEGDLRSVADAFEQGLLQDPQLKVIQVERENLWNGPVLHMRVNYWNGSCIEALRNPQPVRCEQRDSPGSLGESADQLRIEFSKVDGVWRVLDFSPEDFLSSESHEIQRVHAVFWMSCFRYEMAPLMLSRNSMLTCED